MGHKQNGRANPHNHFWCFVSELLSAVIAHDRETAHMVPVPGTYLSFCQPYAMQSERILLLVIRYVLARNYPIVLLLVHELIFSQIC